MIRVLLIAPACDGEDVGESWLAFQWARELAERSDVTVLTSYKAGHTPVSVQLPGVRVIEWAEPPFVGRFERLNSLMQPGYVPFYARARRWIRAMLAAGEHFDVAHQVVPVAMRYPSPAAGLGIPMIIGPVGGSLGSPASFAPEEGATPWYQRLRGLDGLRMRHDPLLRRTYESADLVIAIAPYVADFLDRLAIKRLAFMSETAVHDVQAPIDRVGRPGPVRLLHVGRTVRTKGLRDVIRAMGLLGDLDVVLDVVGDGNDRAACEALAGELGLGERVAFHGALPRAAVDAFYERADIFVFPSYREPGGNVALEAMAFSLPVIVCDRGGPAANVNDTCAVVLPAASPQQLAVDVAGAVRALVTDPDRRHRMGAAARDHVVATHVWPRRFDRMLGFYGEVSDRPPSSS
ncbi:MULTISPECIES: glycosyltransferase family 4 protein [unclassified Microbacterium]|uniref:glycosyltransferase family 4 protein n=1 Tax=unclassified Microbacterium TaxID=2609290 RepID=UPI00214B21B7|nr:MULTISPECIES: glycosyltransferase family 4 protein [unclassified Microbacterium]MCR2785006.1 glycosyltransferase family 4 protein [Microbacterium sp. zg.B96]WIM16545.1 glycosyltransferase family 4 protein [Microbacterium sp. zg-B96]